MTFDAAVGLANGKMLAVNDFICFIDVARSRFAHILPLPQRIMHGKAWSVNPEMIQTPEDESHVSYSNAPEEIKQYDWGIRTVTWKSPNNFYGRESYWT